MQEVGEKFERSHRNMTLNHPSLFFEGDFPYNLVERLIYAPRSSSEAREKSQKQGHQSHQFCVIMEGPHI